MANLFGLNLGRGAIFARFLVGFVAAASVFLLFYYLPASLPAYIANQTGTSGQAAAALSGSLLNPTLQTIGLALTAVVFLCVIVRGTMAYGPLLIVDGLLFSSYVYLLFQGGTVSVNLQPALTGGFAGSLSVNVSLLMYLLLLPTALTTLKGVLITVTSKEDRAKPKW